MSNGDRWRAHPHVPIVIFAHPFELFLSFALIVNGARTLIAGGATPAVNRLPEVPFMVLTVVGLLGGIGMLAGLLSRTKPIGRSIERVGLWLGVSAYWGYAVTLAFTFPIAITWAPVATSTCLGLACLARERAIRKTELTILRVLRKANKDDDLIRHIVDSRGIGEK